jgi:hypothetical protein
MLFAYCISLNNSSCASCNAAKMQRAHTEAFFSSLGSICNSRSRARSAASQATHLSSIVAAAATMQHDLRENRDQQPHSFSSAHASAREMKAQPWCLQHSSCSAPTAPQRCTMQLAIATQSQSVQQHCCTAAAWRCCQQVTGMPGMHLQYLRQCFCSTTTRCTRLRLASNSLSCCCFTPMSTLLPSVSMLLRLHKHVNPLCHLGVLLVC